MASAAVAKPADSQMSAPGHASRGFAAPRPAQTAGAAGRAAAGDSADAECNRMVQKHQRGFRNVLRGRGAKKFVYFTIFGYKFRMAKYNGAQMFVDTRTSSAAAAKSLFSCTSDPATQETVLLKCLSAICAYLKANVPPASEERHLLQLAEAEALYLVCQSVKMGEGFDQVTGPEEVAHDWPTIVIDDEDEDEDDDEDDDVPPPTAPRARSAEAAVPVADAAAAGGRATGAGALQVARTEVIAPVQSEGGATMASPALSPPRAAMAAPPPPGAGALVSASALKRQRIQAMAESLERERVLRQRRDEERDLAKQQQFEARLAALEVVEAAQQEVLQRKRQADENKRQADEVKRKTDAEAEAAAAAVAAERRAVEELERAIPEDDGQ